MYSDKLIKEGVVAKEEVDNVIDKYEKICEEAYKKAGEETQIFHKHWLDSPWSGFFEGKDPSKVKDTGVHEETLTHIGKRFSQGPPNAPDFKIHRAMERILKVCFCYFLIAIFMFFLILTYFLIRNTLEEMKFLIKSNLKNKCMLIKIKNQAKSKN